MSFSDPDPTFQLVSHILNINFTIAFLSCKCVRLHIMMRHTLSLFGNFLLQKKNLLFKIEIFCWEIVKFFKFFTFRVVLLHFGTTAGRIRNDYFRIPIRIQLKVSEPTGSGSITLQVSKVSKKLKLWSGDSRMFSGYFPWPNLEQRQND